MFDEERLKISSMLDMLRCQKRGERRILKESQEDLEALSKIQLYVSELYNLPPENIRGSKDVYVEPTFVPTPVSQSRQTLALYHYSCVQHQTPEYHVERPERLKLVVELFGELHARHSSATFAIFNEPSQGLVYTDF